MTPERSTTSVRADLAWWADIVSVQGATIVPGMPSSGYRKGIGRSREIRGIDAGPARRRDVEESQHALTPSNRPARPARLTP
jgi:hypothetical protein